MPRIPYVFPPQGESPIADKIRLRRKNGELIPLDGVFLNAPSIASGYDALIGAIRNQNSLDPGLRELLILRVAALNGAAYEWKQHEPVGRAGGLTTAQLREIRNVISIGYGPEYAPNSEEFATRLSQSILDGVQLAAMDYTDASTRAIKVSSGAFETLREEVKKAAHEFAIAKGDLNPSDMEKKVNQQMVEMASTVGAYNLVSRFLVAMNVSEMADAEVQEPKDD